MKPSPGHGFILRRIRLRNFDAKVRSAPQVPTRVRPLPAFVSSIYAFPFRPNLVRGRVSRKRTLPVLKYLRESYSGHTVVQIDHPLLLLSKKSSTKHDGPPR